jgi:hypothetical protein
MNIAGILEAIKSSGFATWVRDSLYAFPFVESIHVIGLTLVFGTIAIMDLRLLGIASVHRPFTRVATDLKKWTWLAFVITVVTGLIMFSTNASVYYGNTQFRLKMVAIALSGLNMLVFEWTTGRRAPLWDRDEAAPFPGKVAGALSIVLWITVIFLGRWVGFTATANLEPTAAPDINLDDLFK